MRRILLTGATGYVGGRLLRLLERDPAVAVRCMTRRPGALRARVAAATEVVYGDVLAPESLAGALAGVDTAYYLIHSMGATEDFREADRRGARAFAVAARDAGVRRVIYLGGLGAASDLSPHLESRQEVGRILGAAVATVELRASIVLGSGSLSFEMIRALTERLPLMVTPRWVESRAQPIAIEDVLAYLDAARSLPAGETGIVDIGGPEIVTYMDLMREYASQRGLRRVMVPVPVLTPRLSSLWLGLVTPLYARVGRKLVDSVRNDTVVADGGRARVLFPGIAPRGVREAIARALVHEDRDFAETRWSDAYSAGGETRRWGGDPVGHRRVDSREVRVPVPPAAAFRPIRQIGGERGWYFADALWRLRGFLDLLVGGVGLRRGRRDPEVPWPGDALDFWRVDGYEADRLLRLRAEMKVPGRAWLQFEVEPCEGEPSASRIRQTAVFDPRGLLGLLYWYGLFPLHGPIFRGMLHRIAERAAAGS